MTNRQLQRRHTEAMDLVEQATIAKAHGEYRFAEALFKQAYEYEREVALYLNSHLPQEPSRSIVLRSAASLAHMCREFREAERMICFALAGDPPSEIATELRDLLEQVHFERHLEVRGAVLGSAELQISLSGNGIGLGMAPSQEIFERVDRTQKIYYRTTERKMGRAYRDSGILKRDIAERWQALVSAPRIGSFSVSMRFTSPNKQQEIEGFEGAHPLIKELMECFELFAASAIDELKNRIPDPAYYNNFIGLAQQIVPRGNGISQVTLTAIIDGIERGVALTADSGLYIRPNFTTIRKNLEPADYYSRSIIGRLKFANALRNANKITIVEDSEEEHRLSVPPGMMDDIVKPLWNEMVEAAIVPYKGGWRLLGIRRLVENDI